MSIIIRLLQENEIGLANDFFNSIYKTSRSIEDFKWEFLQGPNGKAIYVIAVDGTVSSFTKIIGIQCAIPLELINSNGEILLTAKSEDTLVDPQYRGQKVFERMYELLFDECKRSGIDFIWGFTPAKKAFERIGFQIPFQAHQGLMVLNPLKAYSYLSRLNNKNGIFDKLKIAGLSVLSWSRTLFHYTAKNEIEIRQLPIQTKVSVTTSSSANSPLYFINMTDDYMKWRIIDNPFDNYYENYQFFNDGKLIGDAILNIRKPELGYLEQLIFADEISTRQKKQVIEHIIKIMKPKVSMIRLLCFDINEMLSEQQRMFQTSGFYILKRGGHFVWKSLSESNVNPHNLFLTRLFTQGNK